MKKKIDKIPNELYINSKKDKRGKGEFKKVIQARISKQDFDTMSNLLEDLGISQSNFIRYAIKLGIEDIQNRI